MTTNAGMAQRQPDPTSARCEAKRGATQVASLADPKVVRMGLVAWFRREGRDLPWRRTTDPNHSP